MRTSDVIALLVTSTWSLVKLIVCIRRRMLSPGPTTTSHHTLRCRVAHPLHPHGRHLLDLDMYQGYTNNVVVQQVLQLQA